MKKNIYKKVAILIAVLAMSMVASAQEKGDMAVGGNLVFGTGDSYSNFGIGAKFQYNVIDPLRLEGSFTYFFEKDYLSMWDLSVNAHYLFRITDSFNVYPLAGLGILGASSGPFSSTDFAFNIGGGADYKITDNLILNAELKYKFSDLNRFLISAGVTYLF